MSTWTIEGPDGVGGYTIRDDTGMERGRYANSKVAAAHHVFALQEMDRLQTIVGTTNQLADADLRERVGRRVRELWILWAQGRPAPKPSWLIPWELLGEEDKEADRCIGAGLYGDFVAEHAEAIAEHALRQVAADAAGGEDG